ncbi:MAG: mucoidy inhibitor MuiA family protein [Ardenticatenaceae bacterium]|nr:mucoidy inhibitor MuiA family protein [Ardenticatenaceae bacterium]
MEIKVESKVTAVTVYPDRAKMTYSGLCSAETGSHQLIIDDLPLVLEPETVRVSGAGSAQVRLLSVDVRRHHYEETPAERVRQLEQEIESMSDKLRQLEDDKAGWLAHAQYLDGLRKATAEFAKGLSRGKSTIDDQLQLTQFLQEQDSTMRAAVRQLEAEQRELKRRLDKLQRELKEVNSARPRQRYQAQIEIEALTAGDFAPELTCLVRNAGWQPLYDVRLTNDGEVAVGYLAQITQNTGQDWQDIDLVVSTARPALNQRLPELKPWFVDEFQPPQPKMQRAASLRAAAADFADAEPPAPAPAMAAPVIEAEVAVAAVQDGGTAVSFAVFGKSSIPSDGAPHKTTLNQFSLPPELDYLAIPKHTDAVYRRAKLTNSGPSPLLAGSVNLFVGDEFIGSSKIEYTPANGEIELLLGVEERITVEREMIKRDVDKRLLRDNRQLRYGYEIKIKNLLPMAVKIELQDQIPVSRHEQIKIKLERVQPEPAEKSELNILEWQLGLAAGAEQVIGYEFSVEHPRSLLVIGLLD